MCVYISTYIIQSLHVRVCTFAYTGTQTSHVSLYILTYRYAESTYVTYTHTESICMCIYLRIHAQLYM